MADSKLLGFLLPGAPDMSRLQAPAGRVTIVFTDIEDSSRMTVALRETYREKFLSEHNLRVRAAVGAHNGYVVKTIGDSFMLAFAHAADAVNCARAIQETISKPPIASSDDTGKTWTLRVRIGVHQALESLTPHHSPECEADYHGSDVNFAARVESLGAGGQVLVSDSAYMSANAAVPEPWQRWPDRRIKSFSQPETVWELLWDGQSRGEPGSRFLPDWFRGEQNRYISRSELESRVLAQFNKLLPDGSMPRLVTLHASGGMGKTRLAVACAIQMVGAFRDGVFFVKLEDCSPSDAAVAEAIGTALGLQQAGSRPDKLLTALGGKDLLLLLDNYESVDCEDVQAFLISLLKSTGSVRLLVTGREAVKISEAEQLIPLEGCLTEAEAEELFLVRARLKDREGQAWQPTDDEMRAISRIVALSERIPLAVELAAAWVKHSTVQEICEGLEAKPLGRQSQEPARSARIDQAERHRSLTRCLNYSFERLEPWAQDGFARLGLIAESFTTDSVKGACGVDEAEDLLLRLQDASLIYRIEHDGCSRYSMLRATRAYAVEKLVVHPELPALRQQCVLYFAEMGIRNHDLAQPTAGASQRNAAFDYFEQEWPNIVAAARCAFETGNWKATARISEGVLEFWETRGHWTEAEQICRLAVEATRRVDDRSSHARELDKLGRVLDLQSRWDEAKQVLQQSIALARDVHDRWMESECLNSLANVLISTGGLADAEQMLKNALTIKRELKDYRGEGPLFNNLGNVYDLRGQWLEAELAFRQVLANCRDHNDRLGEGQALLNVAAAYLSQGRLAEAEQALLEGLAMCQDFKAAQAEAKALNNLAIVYQFRQKWDDALETHLRGLAIERQLSDRAGEGRTLINLGAVYLAKGRLEDAARAYHQALEIMRASKDRTNEGRALTGLGILYSRLSEWHNAKGVYLQSLAIARETNDRVGEMRTLNDLGSALHSLKEANEARQAYHESLSVARNLGDRAFEAQVLFNQGALHLMLSQWPEAEKQFEECLTVSRALNDSIRAGRCLSRLAMLREVANDVPAAIAYAHESIAALQQAGDIPELQHARQVLGRLGNQPQAGAAGAP